MPISDFADPHLDDIAAQQCTFCLLEAFIYITSVPVDANDIALNYSELEEVSFVKSELKLIGNQAFEFREIQLNQEGTEKFD